jgi:RHS repeat-associated protein
VTAKTYTYYGANNQLWTNPSPYTVFAYDALDRLASFNTGAPVTNYVSDGSNIVAEYDGSNVLQKRYAFGPDGPLVAYDASGNRTWMLADERGSVLALASDSGAMTGINTYDEYGIPAATNSGTFQYAGMLWLARPNLYAPTFRAFNAGQGRFNQTDPIGMAGGVNMYTYVGGDPVNFIDPLGLVNCAGEALIALPSTGYIDSSGTPVIEGHYMCVALSDLALPRDRPGGGAANGGGAGGEDTDKKEQCPTGTLGDIRHRAIETAKWSGVASGGLAIAGAIPTPASPGLEGLAIAAQGLSRLSTVVAVGADAAFGFRTGNWQPLLTDSIQASVGEIPLGSIGNAADRLTPGGGSMANSATGKISKEFGNASMNANAAFFWPNSCG